MFNHNILNEYTNIRDINTSISILTKVYSHIIKWCFWEEGRCSSWVNTIDEGISSLAMGYYRYGIGKSHKLSEEEYLKAYNKGKELTIKEALNNAHIPRSRFNDDLLKYNELFDIISLINPDTVMIVLSKYTNTYDERYRDWYSLLSSYYKDVSNKIEFVRKKYDK